MKNYAAAHESDSDDDLTCQMSGGGVLTEQARQGNVEAGSERHQSVGSKTGGVVALLALNSDGDSHARRGSDLNQESYDLHRSFQAMLI
jgi:hypothetical protein